MEIISLMEEGGMVVAQWLGFSTIMFLRYAILAGIAYAFYYKFLKGKLSNKKIQQKYPKISKVWQEVKHSSHTALIFGFLALVVKWMTDQGWTSIYTDFTEYGIVYAVLSFFIMLAIHDTYFYWMHYSMHKIEPLARFHAIHHKSHNPTPWAAMAFHPIEALVEFAFIPLAVIFIPFHPIVLAIFGLYSFIFNVIGHLGFEVFPKWWTKHPILKWMNTSTHHNMHHKNGNGNFGFYFNFWDTLMGTNHKNYLDKFDEVVNRVEGVGNERIEDAILV